MMNSAPAVPLCDILRLLEAASALLREGRIPAAVPLLARASDLLDMRALDAGDRMILGTLLRRLHRASEGAGRSAPPVLPIVHAITNLVAIA